MNAISQIKSENLYRAKHLNVSNPALQKLHTLRPNIAMPAHHTKLSVIILGGFFMTVHHLKKYEQMYRQYGIENIELISPSIHNMTIPRLCERFARQLLRSLETKNNPAVIHMFSGAVWIYYALNDIAHSRERNKIKAVIFESTPLDVKPEQFGRFLAWKFKRNYQRSWSYPFVVFRLLAGISGKWEKRNLIRMTSIPSHLKVLCIYSKTDTITCKQFIEHYLDTLEQKGICVHRLLLNNARHCLAIRDSNPHL